MNRIGLTLITILAVGACTGGVDDPTNTSTPPVGSTTGGSDTTFDHDNDTISPWDLLNRLETEGPPEYTAHMHSCQKVRYLTLGNVLADRGVNVTTDTAAPVGSAAPTAGYLYASGQAALGAENYANRIRENIDITISGESREFDIFAAAAPEIITAFTNNTITACNGATMFDSGGVCQPSGITCLIGTPATAAHLSLCNLTVSKASSQTIGEQMAVAVLLAAAYTCE
jgi:hypothetical protein